MVTTKCLPCRSVSGDTYSIEQGTAQQRLEGARMPKTVLGSRDVAGCDADILGGLVGISGSNETGVSYRNSDPKGRRTSPRPAPQTLDSPPLNLRGGSLVSVLQRLGLTRAVAKYDG